MTVGQPRRDEGSRHDNRQRPIDKGKLSAIHAHVKLLPLPADQPVAMVPAFLVLPEATQGADGGLARLHGQVPAGGESVHAQSRRCSTIFFKTTRSRAVWPIPRRASSWNGWWTEPSAWRSWNRPRLTRQLKSRGSAGARGIRRFVSLWCYTRDRRAAMQLAASERFSWPLPATMIDPCELMHLILTSEASRFVA